VIWVHRITAVIIGLFVAALLCLLAVAAFFHEFGDSIGWLFGPVLFTPVALGCVIAGILSGFFYYWYFRSPKPTSHH
jgi:hypothetical protein